MLLCADASALANKKTIQMLYFMAKFSNDSAIITLFSRACVFCLINLS